MAALKRLGIGEERIEGLSNRFRRGGARCVAVARMTPGVGGYAIVVVGVLAVLAVAGWLIIRARRRAVAETDTSECWADCSCPACVAIISSANRRQPSAG